MRRFDLFLARKVQDYIRLRRSLGHSFVKQAGELRAFSRFVARNDDAGPLNHKLALRFVFSSGITARTRVKRLAGIVRFAEYLSIFDPLTEIPDSSVLPRSRPIPAPRILNDDELARLLSAAREDSPLDPLHGLTLYTIIGLLASSGLRSGEALRLDRTDVDLDRGLLRIRKSKFRKDRMVPVHRSTAIALREYAVARDRAFLPAESPAFFVSLRRCRLSQNSLGVQFRRARVRAGLDDLTPRRVRPHDLRHYPDRRIIPRAFRGTASCKELLRFGSATTRDNQRPSRKVRRSSVGR